MLQLLKNNLWHLPKAILANLIYRFPGRKLTVIGVTGTKGKTSTTHLIHHILSKTGHKTLLISTIGQGIGSKLADTGFHVTSPSPFALQKALRQAVKAGATHAVLEITSHSLDQFRAWGIPFAIAVYTQIVPEHLLYHKTLKRYRSAKAKLLNSSQKVVINQLDPSAEYLLTQAKDHLVNASVYGEKQTDFVAQNQQAAITTVKNLGVSEQNAKQAIATFPGIPGRMETVYRKNFTVVIDFAHTPESLQAALKLLRKKVKGRGRLIAIFGCAGERDKARRKMGAVAAKLADYTIITAEDPRNETVETISQQIAKYAQKAGATEANKDCPLRKGKPIFILIPDRQQAIDFAIRIAHKGDVVGIFGKGHEKSMCFGKIEYPWSDHEAVKKALS